MRFLNLQLSLIEFLLIFTIISSVELKNEEKETKLESYLAERALKEASELIKKEISLNEYRMDPIIDKRNIKRHLYVKFSPVTEQIGSVSIVNIRAYDIMIRRMGIPKKRAMKLLQRRLPKFCQQRNLNCNSSQFFRNSDGTCNNINNPIWGSSFSNFIRLRPSDYDDGFNSPRGGLRKSKLPNSRLISNTIHPDLIKPDARITNMLPQFGQFVDHDISMASEGDKRCCEGAGDPNCWPINIFRTDPFYSNLSKPQTCMDFTRSTPYCFPTGSGVREQMNMLTAYLDASQVYGSESTRTSYLRSYKDGTLKTNLNNPNLLPTVKQVEKEVKDKIDFMGEFFAGDERVNEMPGLATMHTLFFREHNRLANEFKRKKPSWDDEKIFQNTRKILMAEWQNILYGEYLAIVLGNRTMEAYGLTLNDSFSVYNSSIDASVSHAFASAAYRFGHTMINGLVRLFKKSVPAGSYLIRNNFFKSEQLTQQDGYGYNLILEGLMTQNSQVHDRFVTEDLSNFLLKEDKNDFGADLIARNIQRGRDHGVPSYNEYRKFCKLTELTHWRYKPSELPNDTWRKFQGLYSDPSEIDLFTGGLSETPLPGAVSGPTFNCLKAIQFRSLKFGDRFFFTHSDQLGSFNKRQLMAIRKRTLGALICDNSELEATTENVFLVQSSTSNPWIPCKGNKSRELNLDLFL